MPRFLGVCDLGLVVGPHAVGVACGLSLVWLLRLFRVGGRVRALALLPGLSALAIRWVCCRPRFLWFARGLAFASLSGLSA